MKTFKNFNLFLIFLIATMLPFGNVIQAMSFKQLTDFGSKNRSYLAGGLIGLTSTLAFLTMYQNRVKKKELSKVLGENKNLLKELATNKGELAKVTNNSKILEKELNSYKDESAQLAQYEKLLYTTTAYIKSLEESFAQEISVLNSAKFTSCKSTIAVSESSNCETYFSNILKNLSFMIVDKIKNSYSSFSNYQQIVNSELNGLRSVNEQLTLKKFQWNNKDNASHLIKESDILIEKINDLTNSFTYLAGFCEEQKYFIEVIPMLEKDFENIYANEIKVVQSLYQIDSSNFDNLIDIHILSLYSGEQYQFPYLVYAQKIKEDKLSLEKAINNLSQLKLTEFQMEFLKRAQNLKQVLDIVFEHVVTSKKYKEEKSFKPEFERREAQLKAETAEKQARLKVELKEKEAKIEQEKNLAQAKYLNEKNKNQELANQKARIEKDKKEIEQNNNQILLNIAMQNVKQAVDQNDRKWSYEFDQLDSRYKKTKEELESTKRDYTWLLRKYDEAKNNADLFKRDLDQLKTKNSIVQADLEQSKREVVKLKHEIGDLNSKMKTEIHHNDGSAKEVQKLKSAISNAMHYIHELDTALSNPPFNPEMVDGLRSYISRLENRVTIIKTTLSR